MQTCLMCNRALPSELTLRDLFSFACYQNPVICEKCQDTFHLIDKETACPGCSRPQAAREICPDCEKWHSHVPKRLVNHDAFYTYDDALKKWLKSYKFQGDTRFARVMAVNIKTYVSRYPETIIVPIPVSQASFEKRGFNQCEELLRAAEIPYEKWIVNRSVEKKQSEKNRHERLKTAQPFQLDPSFNREVPAVLLFDDVYTTGRTLMHAKQLFADAEIKQIASFSIGR